MAGRDDEQLDDEPAPRAEHPTEPAEGERSEDLPPGADTPG